MWILGILPGTCIFKNPSGNPLRSRSVENVESVPGSASPCLMTGALSEILRPCHPSGEIGPCKGSRNCKHRKHKSSRKTAFNAPGMPFPFYAVQKVPGTQNSNSTGHPHRASALGSRRRSRSLLGNTRKRSSALPVVRCKKGCSKSKCRWLKIALLVFLGPALAQDFPLLRFSHQGTPIAAPVLPHPSLRV
jgi:hypothetical protein